NVRELAAVIERAAILGHGKRLDVAAALGASPPPTRSTAPVKSELTEPSRPVDPSPLAGADAAPSLEAVVRAHIEAALAAARGRIEGPRGAAAALGVNPHTLRARMRKLGVDWARYRSERA